MTVEELLKMPATLDIPTAAHFLGISTRHAYELVARGEFPVEVLRLGRAIRVPTARLCNALGLDGAETAK
ncbi:MAG: helix-turn-helix transcriptional regulator [Actinomycetota bacterium]